MTTTKKKLNRADYMFTNRTGEELIKKPGDVNGLDFAIRDLTDCQVFLLDTTAQVQYLIHSLPFLPSFSL
jgi:protein XRP2